MNTTYDFHVVGGGMGGLMCAAILAHNDKRVMVLEAADRLGGYQQRFEQAEFQIEPHFHFLQQVGPDRPVRKILDALEVDLTFKPLDPIAAYHLPDRTVIFGNDRAAFIDTLIQLFPDERQGITALYEQMIQVYQGLNSGADPANLPPELAADSMDSFMSRYVSDAELKSLIGAWAVYFGYETSQIGALPIIIFTEACWDGGVYHPEGGIQALTDALAAIIENAGGSVRTNSRVKRITLKNEKIQSLIMENGDCLPVNRVISNADPVTTYLDLIGRDLCDPEFVQRLTQKEQFRSPISLFIGVSSNDLNLQDHPAVRIVFPGIENDIFQDDDSTPVSIGIPSCMNPQLVPEGHHLIIAYRFINRPLLEELMASRQMHNDYAETMIKVIESAIPGIRDQIVMLESSIETVKSIYNKNTQGALGWAPALSSMMSAPQMVTPIEGLYLVGQWTPFGPGMNNVFKSADTLAAMLLS